MGDTLDEAKAETVEEADMLLEIARKTAHDKNSDGRQLGTPTQKSYELLIYPNNQLSKSHLAGTKELQEAIDHFMRIDIAGSDMRISTMFSEYYFY
jgi:hypothetical protein